VIAMTTQATNFFTKLCGFQEGSSAELPAAREAHYLANGRNSKILYKDL
jgi:amino-acid N-acetyltransferase